MVIFFLFDKNTYGDISGNSTLSRPECLLFRQMLGDVSFKCKAQHQGDRARVIEKEEPIGNLRLNLDSSSFYFLTYHLFVEFRQQLLYHDIFIRMLVMFGVVDRLVVHLREWEREREREGGVGGRSKAIDSACLFEWVSVRHQSSLYISQLKI